MKNFMDKKSPPLIALTSLVRSIMRLRSARRASYSRSFSFSALNKGGEKKRKRKEKIEQKLGLSKIIIN